MNIKYIPVHLGTENVVICSLCGSLVNTDFTGKHNEWHSNVLRGSLK